MRSSSISRSSETSELRQSANSAVMALTSMRFHRAAGGIRAEVGARAFGIVRQTHALRGILCLYGDIEQRHLARRVVGTVAAPETEHGFRRPTVWARARHRWMDRPQRTPIGKGEVVCDGSVAL